MRGHPNFAVEISNIVKTNYLEKIKKQINKNTAILIYNSIHLFLLCSVLTLMSGAKCLIINIYNSNTICR